MDEFEQDKMNTISIYRELFWKADEEINRQLNLLKDEDLCNSCANPCTLKNKEFSPRQVLAQNCALKEWQLKCLDKLENEISRDICQRIQQIEAHKQNYSCSKCATCCKLACSEFSPQELQEKARNNDNFATQFTSIFLPYKTEKKAREAYPEFVNHLKKELKEGEKIYFYYCPKLGEDNLCTDYANRPQICREFPTNPLILLPKSCGYYQWREDVHISALMLHALVEIVKFNIEQIKKIL
ncbi:MAG: YkgJ family cysteine cluster protein [Candidatus Gastranaerophilales bacterium]|nr:YkgJ family cysteine cluster protein [Candidatus Gastranaerophilales bacterium]